MPAPTDPSLDDFVKKVEVLRMKAKGAARLLGGPGAPLVRPFIDERDEHQKLRRHLPLLGIRHGRGKVGSIHRDDGRRIGICKEE